MSDQMPLPANDPSFLLDALATGEISDEQLDALDELLAKNGPASRELARQVLDTLIIWRWMKADRDPEFVKATAARVAELKRDAEKQFVEVTMQRLRTAAQTQAVSRSNQKQVATSSRPKYVLPGLIALASAACLFLVFRLVTPKTTVNPNEAKLIAAVQATGRDGQVLSPGTALSEGDVVSTGDSGSAQVVYPDGTQIDLRSRTELALLEEPAKNASKLLELRSGEIAADFAPQHNVPAALSTPHARIEVLGTKFILACGHGYTRLEMLKGVVKCARRDGSDSRDVYEAQVALIRNQQPVEIRPSRVTDGLLALYEFREGTGSIAADTSGVLPRADLTRTPVGQVQWSPEGLVVKSVHAMSAGPELFAKNDGVLTKQPQYTVEIWSYLPEKNVSDKRSVHLAHFGLGGMENSKAMERVHAISTSWSQGLRHTVEVFNDKEEYTTYENGVVVTAPATNDADAKTLLPRLNDPDAEFALCATAWSSHRKSQPKAPFELTYRMIAVYSRPLSADEIRRNYNAGPTPWGIPTSKEPAAAHDQ